MRARPLNLCKSNSVERERPAACRLFSELDVYTSDERKYDIENIRSLPPIHFTRYTRNNKIVGYYTLADLRSVCLLGTVTVTNRVFQKGL